MNGTYQYLFRCDQNHKAPVITICYLKDESTGKIARGISVCSPLDPFNYIKGRGKAYGRALKAMKTQSTTDPIKGPKGVVACATAGVFSPMSKVIIQNEKLYDTVFKSKWDVNLTDTLNQSDFRTLAKLKGLVKSAPTFVDTPLNPVSVP